MKRGEMLADRLIGARRQAAIFLRRARIIFHPPQLRIGVVAERPCGDRRLAPAFVFKRRADIKRQARVAGARAEAFDELAGVLLDGYSLGFMTICVWVTMAASLPSSRLISVFHTCKVRPMLIGVVTA